MDANLNLPRLPEILSTRYFGMYDIGYGFSDEAQTISAL